MPPLALSHKLLDPCGKFLPALLYHDVRDRLRGEHSRARARWGTVERPSSTGKLLWVVSGATRESVRLGVEIARAVLARRLDVSVALTYEACYPDLLADLESNARIACGHAPADYAGSMNTVWRRLMPFGVVLAGVAPRPNLIRLSEACRHAMLVTPPGFALGRYERIYPGHRQIYDGRNVAAAADLNVLMLPSPTSDDNRLVGLTAGRHAYLWHGSDADEAKRVFALFRGHMPDSIMLASGPAIAGLTRHSAQTITLGAWPGQPVPPDKLVLVDDTSALAGLMPSLTAAHFVVPDRLLMWQALAAGACLSSPASEWIDAPCAEAQLRLIGSENALIECWHSFVADSELRSAAASRSRHAYAEERSLALNVVNDLLARISAWQ